MDLKSSITIPSKVNHLLQLPKGTGSHQESAACLTIDVADDELCPSCAQIDFDKLILEDTYNYIDRDDPLDFIWATRTVGHIRNFQNCRFCRVTVLAFNDTSTQLDSALLHIDCALIEQILPFQYKIGLARRLWKKKSAGSEIDIAQVARMVSSQAVWFSVNGKMEYNWQENESHSIQVLSDRESRTKTYLHLEILCGRHVDPMTNFDLFKRWTASCGIHHRGKCVLNHKQMVLSPGALRLIVWKKKE